MTSGGKKVISNLFSDVRITAARFLNFCMFAYEALIASNVDGKYDDAISKVKQVIGDIQTQINNVSVGLSAQVNNTWNVDQFIYNFGQFMKNNSGAIAYALGGNSTAAYYQFYPYKTQEYLLASKKTMPMLAGRVASLATQYADSLGTNLTQDLQNFLPGYNKLLSIQRQQITAVKQSRISCKNAFVNGQWTVTGVVLDVASLNNGNPQETDKLFPFAMLLPPKKSKIYTISDKLAVSEMKEELNRTLTEDVTLTVQNSVVNADILLWLAASPKDAIPDTAITVNANTTVNLKAADLGDLKNPFLMVANSSNVNAASFTMGIKGLKKQPKVTAQPDVANSDDMRVAL